MPTIQPVADDSPTPYVDPCGHVPYDGPWAVPPLLPGSAVRVAVAELNLREGPCTASRKHGTVEKGKVLILSAHLDGPVKANGYSWYFVWFPPNAPNGALPKLPENWFPDGTDTSGAWIAANNGATPYVTPLAPRCPTTVDLENVVAMLPSEWLACFDSPIVLKGTYGCGGCGGEGGPISKPNWLADTFEFTQLRVRWGDQFEYRPVGLHFKPSGPARPPEGSVIRVTVHVDDPAAQSCSFVWAIDDPPFTVPNEIGVAWCRERFVVDSYEIVGTDPKYP
jgi:hypothetical protein